MFRSDRTEPFVVLPSWSCHHFLARRIEFYSSCDSAPKFWEVTEDVRGTSGRPRLSRRNWTNPRSFSHRQRLGVIRAQDRERLRKAFKFSLFFLAPLYLLSNFNSFNEEFAFYIKSRFPRFFYFGNRTDLLFFCCCLVLFLEPQCDALVLKFG